MVACPQCSGTGKQRVLSTRDGKPVYVEVPCGFCGGTGDVPAVPYSPPPAAPSKPPPPPLEIWPFMIPIGLFILFFVFLWL